MVLLYHGIELDGGILVAKSGVILSSLEVEIMRLKTMPDTEFKRQFPSQTHEQAAWEVIATPFQGMNNAAELAKLRDREYVCVALEIGPTLYFATKNEGKKGGLVLGMEMDEDDLAAAAGYNRNSVKRIYRKLGLHHSQEKMPQASLRQAYLSRAAQNHRDLIEAAFQHYAPEYRLLR
jgi:hypothetical protein